MNMKKQRATRSFLEIDGGVKVDNIGEIARAGADTFVAGSAIFGKKNKEGYREVISEMKSNIDKSMDDLRREEEREYAHNRA